MRSLPYTYISSRLTTLDLLGSEAVIRPPHQIEIADTDSQVLHGPVRLQMEVIWRNAGYDLVAERGADGFWTAAPAPGDDLLGELADYADALRDQDLLTAAMAASPNVLLSQVADFGEEAWDAWVRNTARLPGLENIDKEDSHVAHPSR